MLLKAKFEPDIQTNPPNILFLIHMDTILNTIQQVPKQTRFSDFSATPFFL
jgi:hypothetical protein